MFQLLDELASEGYSIVDAKTAQTKPKAWYAFR